MYELTTWVSLWCRLPSSHDLRQLRPMWRIEPPHLQGVISSCSGSSSDKQMRQIGFSSVLLFCNEDLSFFWAASSSICSKVKFGFYMSNEKFAEECNRTIASIPSVIVLLREYIWVSLAILISLSYRVLIESMLSYGTAAPFRSASNFLPAESFCLTSSFFTRKRTRPNFITSPRPTLSDSEYSFTFWVLCYMSSGVISLRAFWF